MLTSAQRAQLKGLASKLDAVIFVGKNGITDNVVQETENSLRAHELIKGKVLENSEYSPREAVAELAERCKAEPVQTIGSKFVLYRENKDIPEEKRIALVKKK